MRGALPSAPLAPRHTTYSRPSTSTAHDRAGRECGGEQLAHAGEPSRVARRSRSSSDAPRATARPSTKHSSGAFVRSPLSCAAKPARSSSCSAAVASTSSVAGSMPGGGGDAQCRLGDPVHRVPSRQLTIRSDARVQLTRRIGRADREDRDAAALAAQHVAPQRVGRRCEGIRRHRVDDEPGALVELGLELARAPSPRSRRTRGARASSRAEPASDRGRGRRCRGRRGAAPSRCRRSASPRASAMTASGETGPPMNTTRGRARDVVPVGEHVVERGRARPVEHDAERAVVAVFEHRASRCGRSSDRRAAASRRAAGRAWRQAVLDSRRLALAPVSRAATSHPRVRSPPSVLDELRDAVGAEHVLTDPDVVAGYVVDWTGRFRGATPAVVRPGDVDEVARVVRDLRDARASRSCRRAATPASSADRCRCTARSSSTCAASTRSARSTRRRRRSPRAPASRSRACRRTRASAGWEYGVDLGARDTATVGGTVATNAGGVHVLRYGSTRRQVVGVEAVLADGSVIGRLDGLEKDNTGYDLGGLLCGSEGTLAVVTAARLRLVPASAARRRRVARVRRCRRRARRGRGAAAGGRRACAALEFFEQRGLDLVCAQLGRRRRRFRAHHGAYVLVEAAGRSDPTDGARRGRRRTRARARRRGGDRRTRGRTRCGATARRTPRRSTARPAAQARRDAAGRSARASSSRASGPPSRRSRPTRRCGCSVTRATATCTSTSPASNPTTSASPTRCCASSPSCTVRSAPSTASASRSGRWVHLTRSPAELHAFRAIKDALDPNGILNPHVLVP